MLGRAPLDEDAIRTIEDQHPDIEFDWPAILALSEVMTPEDEAPAAAPRKQGAARKNKNERRRDDRTPREESPRASGERRHDAEPGTQLAPSEPDTQPLESLESLESLEPLEPIEPSEPRNRLVEELAGREIGARLRARHAEIVARIEALDIDGAAKDALFTKAEAIDPELWMTPESVLEGVRNADVWFEKLKAEVSPPSR